MALIEDRAGKGREDGGYYRLFGDRKLTKLLSQVHGTVISAGYELEKIIAELVKPIDDLDAFFSRKAMPPGVWRAQKEQIKACQMFKDTSTEPDFMIFKRRNRRPHCYLVELKDGDTFDTKKAQGEYDALKKFRDQIDPKFPYSASIHFCSFNLDKRSKIVAGFKSKIDKEDVLTGPEFCKLLGINYKAIVKDRRRERPVNLRYFVQRLKKIPSVSRAWNANGGMHL